MQLFVTQSIRVIRTQRFAKLLCRHSSTSQLIESLLSMPKHGDQQQLKMQRLKIKEKGMKYSPGTVTLQVLGSGARGAPRSLYLFTDQARYLFNVGEGSQRLAHEHKMKLSKLEHIFITQPIWENLGGLPGVALTIQDVGVPMITLHGPKGTEDMFAATRRFVVLKELEIKMADCDEGGCYDDNVMTVDYVPIYPEGYNLSEENKESTQSLDVGDDVDYYGHERPPGYIRRGSQSPKARKKYQPVPNCRISPTVMCFVCKLKTKPGQLRLEACVERGVPPGPLLGQLKAGNDVTLPDGTVVRSADVTSPDEPGPVFLVVDCPDTSYLSPLTSSETWQKYQMNGDSELKAHTVVHFAPPDVIKCEEYKNWVEKFPATTIHLYLNTDNKCTGSVAVHRIQHQLNEVHPTVFPLLPCAVGDGLSSTLTCSLLRPRGDLDQTLVPTLTPSLYTSEPYHTDEFKRELDRLKEAIAMNKSNGEMKLGEYPQVVFLGTGSCIPNKTRNVSAILLFTSATTSILLDCGEATYHQLWRFYGSETGRVLSTLKAVYVSHLHADHHIGLVGILKGRREFVKDQGPLNLIAPEQIMSWLNLYHTRFEDVLQDFKLVTATELCVTRTDDSNVRPMLDSLGCSDVRTVGVKHCPNAFGVALTHRDGWKLTYSGDTMPCQDLVSLGLDSDILIHEATMEDELEDEAKYKYHSTTSQALSVGKAMRAKYILLTHFSQRYAKLPRINGECPPNVGIAFDNMQVFLNQMSSLALMYPVLKLLFAEHVDEMDAKAFRRSVRKEAKRQASESPHRITKILH